MFCVTIGTATKINVVNEGSSYDGCGVCKRKTTETKAFKCELCQAKNQEPVVKFVLIYCVIYDIAIASYKHNYIIFTNIL